jgi:isocitrate dehydrogenase
MTQGDFYGTEQSYIMPQAGNVRIEWVGKDGSKKVLKESVQLKAGEVIDASMLSVKQLCTFLEQEMAEAYKDHVLFSVHLKATMMKVSDPIMFGHVVRVFLQPVFTKHAQAFNSVKVNPNYGLADLYDKIKRLPESTQAEIQHDIMDTFNKRPWLAMVDSAKGITNLHVPSDVIIDASMPVVVRDSGKMWNKDNELEDVKCVIPDRSYALIYQEMMSFCKQSGQFDVATMVSLLLHWMIIMTVIMATLPDLYG